jgi:predicted ATPase/DNA-binding SARP family transcriptional activator
VKESRGDEIRVLGPLEIVGGMGTVAQPALKQRQLLAALLVGSDKTCSSDLLVDALWGASPPRSAPKLLQVYVSKLRKVLPSSARIRTQGSGYALELADGVLDSDRFERLIAEGREAAQTGNPALAESLLRRALALWRGQAYGELVYNEFVRAEAERLEELRLLAVVERIDAELELGRHVELLPELRSLAAEHTLRERLQAQAMLALYRSGRQSEALDLYSTTRAHLHEELGLEPGAELRDLQRRILRHDPTLVAASNLEDARGAFLPVPPNPLLGREREVQELGELLRRGEVRLLVLTGAGGSGKTRLALEAARKNARSFANGAAFVGLASLHDPGLIVTAISSALGIELAGDPLESLAEALRSREMLVLVDNAEHLREATPIFVELVSRAPRLTLLVTSRVVLHLSGEHVYPVEPLAEEAAVALFLERAREADARFHRDAEAEHTIRRICKRLDGMPLAIELAAGRIRMRTPQELLDGLEQRLPLLTGGPRDLPARQQTLRATLEWSVDLLDEHERRDLARLSVFAGGCTLEAAEAVCEATLERLSSLVDQSLLLHSVGPHGSRYSLLETIRELASELLEASGEADELRRRHAEHALFLAQSLGLSVDELGSGVRQRHDLALAEQDNMRAALDWALGEDPVLGLELAIALEQFWVAASPREGMQRFEALLERTESIPLDLRARALRDFGGTAEVCGEIERAAAAYEQSRELFERLGHEKGILRLLHRLGNIARARGDLAAARELGEDGLRRARGGGYRYEESDFLAALSHLEFRQGNVERALELQLSALAIVRESGGWAWGEPQYLVSAGEYSFLLDRLQDAETYAQQAFTLSRGIGDRTTATYALAVLALAARARGDAERAGRLWGAIEAEEDRALLPGWPADRERYAKRILTPESPELTRGLEKGRQLTFDDAAA